MNSSLLVVINSFINEWIILHDVSSVLNYRSSTFNLFEIKNTKIVDIKSAYENIEAKKEYDLIIGDLPIGMNYEELVLNNGKILVHKNWIEIYKLLVLLNLKGVGIFVIEPSGFSTIKGQSFEKILNESGFFVNAYLKMPDGLFKPETTICPVLVIISRNKKQKVFAAELIDNSQINEIIKNYASEINTDDFSRGKFIEPENFFGFEGMKVREQLSRLETQYKTFEEYKLEALSNEIKSIKSFSKDDDNKNVIYVPRIGNSDVIFNIQEAKLKAHNYFKITLKDIVLNEYLTSFFRSKFGKLILNELTSRTYIPHLNISDLANALVVIPSYDEQLLIVNTQRKLKSLKIAISAFDTELAVNPSSSYSIMSQIDSMLKAIGALTEADRIRSLVREGESKYIEFKETLSFDIRTQTKEKRIEDSAIKTIVAFINTDGGRLLIGVSDDGNIVGIDSEVSKLYKNIDAYLLKLKNIIKERIGPEYYPFIEYQLIKIDDINIVEIECVKSKTPCYLDHADFYVRINPATDKLEGPKMVEYIKNHFKEYINI